MAVQLSERLALIASYIHGGERVADIGSDHGYLPMALAEEGICSKIIVTDVNAGPLARARQNLGDWARKTARDGAIIGAPGEFPRVSGGASGEKAAEMSATEVTSLFDFRLGNGLEPLALAEVDVAVIAGMGGELMTQILSADLRKTRSIGRYILQPRKGSEKLRRWIDDNRYYVADENLVREGDFICELLVMETGEGCGANDGCVGYEVSAALLRRNPPLLREFLARKLRIEREILAAVQGAGGGAARARAELTVRRIAAFEGLLTDLDASSA